jgi:hypothetical protein
MNTTKLELLATAQRLQSAKEDMAMLARGGTAQEVGRRCLLLCYIIAPDLIGTQRELARRLGVTEGRASQMLKAVRRNLGAHLTAS